ncbi:porin family protein [Aequorivita todarodis]|uniref:porin family protein n=1 Tax=Aequorivita todarodis TaxID=2036821 RepID=UPI0023500531|nr:porin family protein [Aequorivita todarodis]MDC7999793.1 porin family protein [Aequorivita todarodis]
MKKLLLLTAVALFAFTTAQSQEFRIGAKAGLNVASIGGDYVGGLDPRVSFHLGGLVEIPLAGKFALQPELLYSSQGAKYGSYLGVDLGDYEEKILLDYINVPIMGKYYIIEGLSVELGPQVGILVNAKYKGEDEDGSFDVDAKEDYNSLDIAIGIGASYRLNNGVFFSLRFNKGLMDISDDDDEYFEEGNYYRYSYKNQNNVFQVSAGYSF